MNRFNLPDVNFFEKSPEDIERNLLFNIEEETGQTLSNADPRRKFLQGLTAYVVQERNNLDYALKQTLLAYAEDEFLDHKGEEFNTPRIAEKAAVTTMEFILEAERVDVLVIPSGTRFLVAENVFFATEKITVVPVGVHRVEIYSICTETGEIGNGYLPGEITNLVDPVPWVKSVKNLTTTNGGAEVEENDPYAARIRLVPESYSTAGPEGAYEYWAKTTSQQIADVKALSPSPGVIKILVLLKDGEMPSQELLDEVLIVCSDKTVRPLTDNVIASGPEVVSYDALVQYWVLETKAALLNSIQIDVNNAFQDFLKWQREKMGRDVDLSELIVRLKAAGAHRVTINSAMYLQVASDQVAKENITDLDFGGLTDE